MSAGGYVRKARKAGNPQGSLARYNTCSCHPCEYGMKKGLRRARRRVDKEIVAQDRREADEEL